MIYKKIISSHSIELKRTQFSITKTKLHYLKQLIYKILLNENQIVLIQINIKAKLNLIQIKIIFLTNFIYDIICILINNLI